MREPSYFCSLLDDAAALGDVPALHRLANRCGRFRDSAVAIRFRAAAEYRALAVGARKRGRIDDALRCEDKSERELHGAAQFGKERT